MRHVVTLTENETSTAQCKGADETHDAGVTCDGLVVRYGAHVAVDGVTLRARSGEVLGLLGPNGAGKTTVIRALSTMVPRVAGQATVAGAALEDAATVRARVGVLAESIGFPGHQTAREYLRFHGELYGLHPRAAQHRAHTLLESVGLRERAGARIKTFSRGMRQRLGIARALVNDPQVLFLDEPTLGLDPAGQEDILRHIWSIASGGRTVIVSSHLLDEIERTCDRVTIMNRGRVVAAGTVSDVIREAGVTATVRIRVPADRAEQALEALASRQPRGASGPPARSARRRDPRGDGTGRIRQRHRRRRARRGCTPHVLRRRGRSTLGGVPQADP